MQIRIGLGYLAEGINQQVASFLAVNTAKEEKKSLSTSLGASLEERVLQQFRALGGRAAGAVGNDIGIPVVQPEALFGKALLSGTGEKNAVRIAEDTILGGNPVEPLLDMFQRKGMLEVGIEHT